jgi:hypothetical protein
MKLELKLSPVTCVGKASRKMHMLKLTLRMFILESKFNVVYAANFSKTSNR